MGSIENLPENIIHHILSFLEPRESARTSTSCNNWFRAWQTQPNLVCNEKYFPCTKKFVDYTNGSLMRYQESKISIEKLKLVTYRFNFDNLSLLLDKWIGMAMNIGLKKLELVSHFGYCVPAKVFELLEEISLAHCNIEKLHEIPKKISCFCLKRLSLSGVFFQEGALENILSICQSIEFLNLERVQVGNEGKLKVQARNLKELCVECTSSQLVEVQAPILEVFTCTTKRNAPSRATLSFSLDTTQNIKFLRLSQMNVFYITKGYQFPKIENLIIEFCFMRYLHLSSQSLKNLTVRYCHDLGFMKVDCSDKFQFEFISRSTFIPKIGFTNSSKHSVSNVHLAILDSGQFWRLKNLLKGLMPSKISLTIDRMINTPSSHEGKIKFEKEYELPIPIHQLSLGSQSCSTFYIQPVVYNHISPPLEFSAIIDGIFWTCRPTLIELHQSHPCDEFSRFLVWKLLVGRDKSYCGSQKTKIWERDLKEVKVNLFVKRWKLKEREPKSGDWRTSMNPEMYSMKDMYSLKDTYSIEDMYSKEDILSIGNLFFSITCDWEKSSLNQEALSSDRTINQG